MSLMGCLLVLLGGFLGGVARFYISGTIGRWIGETFPWGTFVVNVSGCLLIGMLAGLMRTADGQFAGELFRDFAFVGVCGGYTTVSSFCLQTLNLAMDGEPQRAAGNVVLSVVACMVAVAIGDLAVLRIAA